MILIKTNDYYRGVCRNSYHMEVFWQIIEKPISTEAILCLWLFVQKYVDEIVGVGIFILFGTK